MTTDNTPRITPRLVLGVAVLLAGIAFTLDNLGILDAGEFLDYWPLVFVALGLAKLVGAGRTGGWLSAGLWIFVGAWWTLYNLAVVDLHPVDLWPVFLIVAGLYLVQRALRPGRRSEPSPDKVTGFAVLGGSSKKSSSQEFKGGDFTAVMGGCEVDLRDARIADGPAVIDVFAFWGGVDIRVPPDWEVDGQVTAILGGFDNRSGTGQIDHSQLLVVRGLAMMGGVDVRS
jgi:predicted membrane protein